MNKWIGAMLQLMAAGLFVAAGAEEEILVFPAAAAQLAGLALWGRTRATAIAAARSEKQILDGRLTRIEEAITGVQADVGQLREGQQFMDELYGSNGGRARELLRGDRPGQVTP